MRLLLDQNLSPRLVKALEADYPDSGHVRDFDPQRADGTAIWEFAGERDFVILSKDADFHQLSFLHGHPPKVIWLRVGNRSTAEILEVIRGHKARIVGFVDDPQASFLTTS